MLRPRFYTRQPLTEGQSLTLEKEPSRHIARALRMRVDDLICLFDGSGGETRAIITAIDKDRVSVTLSAAVKIDRESPLDVTLIVSLSRGDRMDTIVQKATELGVTTILPMISERTGVRLDAARLEKKRLHWERIAISACEQCGRNRVPLITGPDTYSDALARVSDNPSSVKLVLHPDGDTAMLPEHCQALTLLVGPEGGFSDSEVGAAAAAGFSAFQLGPRILRTETAPLAALAVAQARWGDL